MKRQSHAESTLCDIDGKNTPESSPLSSRHALFTETHFPEQSAQKREKGSLLPSLSLSLSLPLSLSFSQIPLFDCRPLRTYNNNIFPFLAVEGLGMGGCRSWMGGGTCVCVCVCMCVYLLSSASAYLCAVSGRGVFAVDGSKWMCMSPGLE